MSKTLSFGYTDTAFGVPATLNFVRANTNYGSDFSPVKQTPGETIITNITAPTDRPEKIRIAYSEVKDVYAGSNIDAAYMAPSRKGFSLVSQITEVARVTESVDASFYDLPISAHIVIKAPANELITASVLETVLKRLLSSLYNDNVTTIARFNELIRGVVTPPEV